MLYDKIVKKGVLYLNNKRNHKILLIASIIIMISLIVIWMFEIMTNQLPYVDRWTRNYVDYLDNTSFFYIFRGITELGSGSFFIPFVLMGVVILLVLFKRMLPAIIFSLGTFSTHLLNKLIKLIVRRDRPSVWAEVNAEGFSFPSGHAMISVVCYGIFIYYLNNKIKSEKLKKYLIITITLLIFLIGISRYVINVHYLTDILAGFSIGGLCLLLLVTLDKAIFKIKKF